MLRRCHMPRARFDKIMPDMSPDAAAAAVTTCCSMLPLRYALRELATLQRWQYATVTLAQANTPYRQSCHIVAVASTRGFMPLFAYALRHYALLIDDVYCRGYK